MYTFFYSHTIITNNRSKHLKQHTVIILYKYINFCCKALVVNIFHKFYSRDICCSKDHEHNDPLLVCSLVRNINVLLFIYLLPYIKHIISNMKVSDHKGFAAFSQQYHRAQTTIAIVFLIIFSHKHYLYL